MTLVFLLEWLVMTVGKIPFTSHELLARASVAIATARRSEALWDRTALFALKAVECDTNFRELSFYSG